MEEREPKEVTPVSDEDIAIGRYFMKLMDHMKSVGLKDLRENFIRQSKRAIQDGLLIGDVSRAQLVKSEMEIWAGLCKDLEPAQENISAAFQRLSMMYSAEAIRKSKATPIQ